MPLRGIARLTAGFDARLRREWDKLIRSVDWVDGSTIALSGSGQLRGVGQSVQVGRSGPQSIGSGVWTAVSFDEEAWDTDGFHESVTNPTRITVPVGLAGKYLIVGTLTWAASAAGSVRSSRVKVGSTVATTKDSSAAAAGVATAFSEDFTAVVAGASSDILTVEVQQDSGGNLDLSDITLTVTRIAA